MNAWMARGAVLWPGVVVSGVVATAALFLAEHYGAPVMLFALLLGMAVNFLSDDGRCKAGIELVAREVVRWGGARVGLKITAAQVQAMGWQPVLMVVLAVSLTIAVGLLLARWMGFRPFFGLLSGGSVGICGASAALAIAAAVPNHPQKDRATLFVVISVSTLSTVAMIAYPMLARALGLDEQQAGFFLGGTIHDVAQVVGAGYGMSQATGDAATVIKLMRVAMLVPVIMVASVFALRLAAPTDSSGHSSESAADPVAPGKRPPLLPWFAVVFVLLILLNSFLPLPAAMVDAGNALSRVCLVAAMSAIGMKTHLKDILSVGWKPVAAVVLETLWLALLMLGLLQIGR